MSSSKETKIVIELISDTQGEMYMLAQKRGYDVVDFSNHYLKSYFCRSEMDAVYSKYQTEFADECLNIVLHEFEENNIEINKSSAITANDAYKVGYFYRQLFFALDLSSEKLVDKVSFNNLYDDLVSMEEYLEEEIVNSLKEKYS